MRVTKNPVVAKVIQAVVLRAVLLWQSPVAQVPENPAIQSMLLYGIRLQKPSIVPVISLVRDGLD
jgi:hypothetical protein